MREQRKVVTVLFCDLVGSTALGESTDPEALRARMRRYFEDLRTIIERHGGSAEKFAGVGRKEDLHRDRFGARIIARVRAGMQMQRLIRNAGRA